MNYFLLEQISEKIENKIPNRYRKLISLGLAKAAIAVTSEDDIVAIIVFTLTDSNMTALTLEFIDVKEEYRGKGVGKNLLNYALNLFAVRGYKTICSYIYPLKDETPSEYERKKAFIESMGFECQDDYARRMDFFVGSFKQSELYRKLVENQAILSNVKMLSEVSYQQIEEFRAKLFEEKKEELLILLDDDYSCFYVQDDKILAVANYISVTQELIIRAYIHLLEEAEEKIVYPAMLGAFVHNCVSADDNKKSIVMFTSSKSEGNGIMRLMGDGVSEQPVMYYSRLV